MENVRLSGGLLHELFTICIIQVVVSQVLRMGYTDTMLLKS